MDIRLSESVEFDSVEAFFKSDFILSEVKKAMEKEKPRFDEVMLLRRFSMCKLMYSNVQRSGTIANMTVEEFGRRVDLGDHSVVSVRTHKTANRYGSARVVINKDVVPVIQR